MNVMDLGFRQGEERRLSPPEYDNDDELICDWCGEIIERGKGNFYYEKDDGRVLCEECAKDAAIEALYDEMEEA